MKGRKQKKLITRTSCLIEIARKIKPSQRRRIGLEGKKERATRRKLYLSLLFFKWRKRERLRKVETWFDAGNSREVMSHTVLREIQVSSVIVNHCNLSLELQFFLAQTNLVVVLLPGRASKLGRMEY